jgi:glyoxylase-like metal-dependent hydrolase (beta-lactamase superfamily II)
MREIVKDVMTWTWFSQPHGYNFNGWLLKLPGGNICVDPVDPPPEVLEEIVHNRVSQILLTNRNHSRAANQVRMRTGALTLIHPADAEHACNQQTEVDGELQVGEKIGPLTVVGVPGKSPGEVALHWPERGILFIGDAVIGNPPGRCGLLREQVMDDPPQLRASVKQLLSLDFDILLVGDGEPILRDAKERFRELVATFLA